MGTKIRQMAGMRRPDEEALKRALGVQSQSRRQWKAELHYKRALERGGDRRLPPTDHTVTYSSRQQEALQGGQGSNQHKLCKTTKPFPLGTNI